MNKELINEIIEFIKDNNPSKDVLAKEKMKLCKKYKVKKIPTDIQIFLNASPEQLKNINIIGLMCVAPDVGAEKTRPYFQQMKKLKEKLNLSELSMGMSNDYWIAIEEGATMVRLGRILYKKFDYCCG